MSNKLRPLSEFQDALFHYRYGGSFLLLVASLLLCEVTGTLAVFLYIAQRQFKIDIDTEREEVLKRNLLSLMLPDLKGISVDGGDKRTSHDSAITRVQPMLRIVCEDEDGVPVPAGPIAFTTTTSPVVDHNFLSAEFGLSDPAMYFYGRHGSRGRRNSRSNESFLGSSQGGSEQNRSRKNSFTSATDEREVVEQQQQLPAPPPPPPPAQHPNPNLKKMLGSKQKSVDLLPAITVGRHHSPPPFIPKSSTSSSFHPRDSMDCPGPPGLMELRVPSLIQQQQQQQQQHQSMSFRQPAFKAMDEPPNKQSIYASSSSSSSKKTRFQRYGQQQQQQQQQQMTMRSESEELVESIPYFLPLSNLEHSNNHSHSGTASRDKSSNAPPRNRLTKQMSLNISNSNNSSSNNPNRSTYV